MRTKEIYSNSHNKIVCHKATITLRQSAFASLRWDVAGISCHRCSYFPPFSRFPNRTELLSEMARERLVIDVQLLASDNSLLQIFKMNIN